jgi:hypothetical protein
LKVVFWAISAAASAGQVRKSPQEHPYANIETKCNRFAKATAKYGLPADGEGAKNKKALGKQPRACFLKD